MSIRKHCLILCLTLSILTFLGCVSFGRSQSDFLISLPIDCKLGKDCFIFHYVDTEPSSEAIDFNCGRQTYNDHTGTDFGITNLKAMEKGVKVVAVAPGKVKRVRDGIIDKLIVDQTDKDEVTDRECGNGIVIDHGGGWETQYCHLKQGSVLVKPDTQVEKGTPLGLVGASGLASFPHVHLTVRHENKVIDPFMGKEAISGCKTDKKPLWEAKIDYQPTGLINAGFAPQPPKSVELWEGKFLDQKLSKNSSALVFWVHLYGIIQGDIESFTLIDPKGKVIIEQNKPVKRSYRNWVTYVGKKNTPDNPIISGIWRGKYQLTKNDKVILEVSQEVEII
ncbi:M23 family metallopeptidase [Crocosphaera sp. XPORK-15E]|uniref:M23 family metallopeptidase n=1 Tax=Crocosphaera sp. XPORK-15E TaxID=3110247 RepID=UPI002B2138E8|nr:M23 family metallopeptidase [Crocosphaera sp. XPORK-15E]MEA5533540.1 M23 family metallopeptidase [Crocosphaera sp. XPORK-15E]